MEWKRNREGGREACGRKNEKGTSMERKMRRGRKEKMRLGEYRVEEKEREAEGKRGVRVWSGRKEGERRKREGDGVVMLMEQGDADGGEEGRDGGRKGGRVRLTGYVLLIRETHGYA